MATKKLGNVKVELSNEHCGTDADGHTWLEYWDGAWRANCQHPDPDIVHRTRCQRVNRREPGLTIDLVELGLWIITIFSLKNVLL